MSRIYQAIYVLACSSVLVVSLSQSRHYGCRYSPQMCNGLQTCIDDQLFGSCQDVMVRPDLYQFRLSSKLKHVLEYALNGLLQLGYGWSDAYTQCIVGGLLDSFKQRITPELGLCDLEELSRINQLQTKAEKEKPTAAYTESASSHVVASSASVNRTFQKLLQRYMATQQEMMHTLIKSAGTSENLSPSDTVLLHKLLNDEMLVDELTLAQMKRLRAYLQSVIPTTKAAVKEEQTIPNKFAESTQSVVDVTNGSTGDAAVDQAKEVISAIVRKFTERRGQGSGQSSMSKEPFVEDILGHEISNQLKRMDQIGSSQYVDKKSITQSDPAILEQDLNETVVVQQSQSSDVIDTTYAWLLLDRIVNETVAEIAVGLIGAALDLPSQAFARASVEDKHIVFQVTPNSQLNASVVAHLIGGIYKQRIEDGLGVRIKQTGIGRGQVKLQIEPEERLTSTYNVTLFALIAVACTIILAIAILLSWRYMYSKWSYTVNKAKTLSSCSESEASHSSYEDLCRQRIKNTSGETDYVAPLRQATRESITEKNKSPRSSTSSWNEEPVSLHLDISMGHTVLAYMEDHLKNIERLNEEWAALEQYTPDECSTVVALLDENRSKNRYPSILPYDHSRVVLGTCTEDNPSGYINASFICDHDPRSPAYVATQMPLDSTVADFWQMVWEQECTVIVTLMAANEASALPNYTQFWPADGQRIYADFEVLLVSEHIWCEAYLVRNFYLKGLETNQTRSVTQFHYLSWPEGSVPKSFKDLLDFRRKVNKSYKGKASPSIICCSDGSGSTGAYILLDMVINRINQGAKEMDIAATLEHIRDQRMATVKTREQFEFVLAAVAEEVQAVLRSLPQ